MQEINILGSKLKQIRLNNKLTQKQVADYLHIYKSYISFVENGKTKISAVNLEKLAHLYRVPVKDFVDNSPFHVINPKIKMNTFTVDELKAISEINKLFLISEFINNLEKK